jgi:hypothetical protein
VVSGTRPAATLLSLPLLAAVLASPAPASAGYDTELRYEAPAPAARLGGVIGTTLLLAREPEKGDDDPGSIGIVRAGLGFPYGVRARGAGADEVVGSMLVDSLRAAGWDARRGAVPGAPELRGTLRTLWCDGYGGRYEMHFVLLLELFPPGADGPAFRTEVSAHGGVTVQWSAGELAKGYSRMFGDAIAQLVPAFSSPEFRGAVGVGSSPAGPTEAAATAAGPASPPPAVAAPPPAGSASPVAPGSTRPEDWRDRFVRVDRTNGTWIDGTLVGVDGPVLILLKDDGRLLEVRREDIELISPLR